MDFDLSQLLNARSFTIFVEEAVVLLGIVLLTEVKKKRPTIPESFFDGLNLILVTLMPTIAIFHALIESHLVVHYAVLVFVVYLAVWFMYLRLKYERISAAIYVVFGFLIVFVIIMYGMAYFLTK